MATAEQVKRWARVGKQVDTLLAQPRPRPASAKPPTKAFRKPPMMIFKEWASSQVAAYRVGLVLGYIAMTYFGASALLIGLPAFESTTPEGWTGVWGVAVTAGGLIGAVGSLRAGTEPVTREIRVFNRVELVGAILLFLTLGTYAAVLLILGYIYEDAGRASNGAGFVALGIHPAVRMVWLIFRPRFLAITKHMHHTGVILLAPPGYALVRIDEHGIVIPETREQTIARLKAASERLEAESAANHPGLKGA